MTPTEKLELCPRCRGKGEVKNINLGLAILSFGVTAVIDAALPNKCNICKGTGIAPLRRRAASARGRE